MKRIVYLILPVFALFISCGNDYNSLSKESEADLHTLDEVIERSAEYAARVRAPIDSLSRLTTHTADPRQVSTLLAQMADNISPLNGDSAIRYADAALEAALRAEDDSIIVNAKLAKLKALATSGIFNLAERQLAELERDNLTPHQKAYLWQTARQLYAYAQMYTESNYEISRNFREKSMAYDDSLMMILPAGDSFRRFLMAERDMSHGNYSRAKGTLDSLMANMKECDSLYGMTAFQMSQYYKQHGDKQLYGHYLVQAAKSDIIRGVREGLALFNLANWLYENGHVTESFRYVNFAMNEAMSGHARMRAVNIATMLPMIDERYREMTWRSHTQLRIFLTIGIIVAVILACVLVLLIIQRRKSIRSRTKINELIKARETHLANFLALCSTYYHKLNSLRTLVKRKIASGQTDELMKLVKNGRFAEEDSVEIFSSFDRSFVEIYPDFIDQINHLLRPEERFVLPSDHTLPAELRIYALVTMGISESQRIAQILNYSINTVYTYRNKMRNKAVDRDNFEQNVALISSYIQDM